MATTHKVDIFKVLGDINKKDQNFYSKLSDEEKKALHPLVLMKWMSGTTSERQIMFLSEFANRYMFSLSNHKDLLMKLLVVCSPGTWTKYNWNKAKSSKGSKTPMLIDLVKDTYQYSTSKAVEVLPILDDNDILELAIDLGRQTQEIRDIKKELKTRNNVRL